MPFNLLNQISCDMMTCHVSVPLIFNMCLVTKKAMDESSVSIKLVTCKLHLDTAKLA